MSTPPAKPSSALQRHGFRLDWPVLTHICNNRGLHQEEIMQGSRISASVQYCALLVAHLAVQAVGVLGCKHDSIHRTTKLPHKFLK